MGGRSSEHEISVTSARSVVAALDPGRYDVRSIEISRDGRWQLPRRVRGELGGVETSDPTAAAFPDGDSDAGLPIPTGTRTPEPFGDVDVVFPVLHGPFGEDGTVQGLLELAGVAYVGSGVTASALAMDKDLFKSVMRDKGIPVARSMTVRRWERDRVESPFGFPLVVKPARLGSSVGISIARDPRELDAAGGRPGPPRTEQLTSMHSAFDSSTTRRRS